METHKISGSFIIKFFPELTWKAKKVKDGKEVEVIETPTLKFDAPSTIKELAQVARDKNFHFAGKNDKGEVVAEKDFPQAEETICGHWERGFSLSGQSSTANLSAEDKAERKLDRKAERETFKEMAQAEEIKAAIARKKAALKAAAIAK